ncbi:hypothetical protein D4764_15G0008480 [Takifugu flavidus]|uniref:DDE Tnp4 domain-containing protein n=1 Tax=Takifugu flavidus TaxID=433684 RepID=A0A5C6P0Z7_9TELE|nr:hypothetical protein D4764_15G0008480 [Takifugu flavidus]
MSDKVLSLKNRTIKFPSLVDIPNIAAGFQRLSGSPALQNVVGSIDGCHIRIKSPAAPEPYRTAGACLVPALVPPPVPDSPSGLSEYGEPDSEKEWLSPQAEAMRHGGRIEGLPPIASSMRGNYFHLSAVTSPDLVPDPDSGL